jgi:hypothetical protein
VTVLNELQTWWQNLSPEIEAYLLEGGVTLAALLAGLLLGAIVARALRARNFDAIFQLPGSSPAGSEPRHGFTPSFIVGFLVRLTVWARAACWLAGRHGWVEFGDMAVLTIKRTWAVVVLLVAALTFGSLLAHRLIDCLQGVTKPGSEAYPSRNGATPARSVAGAVIAGAHVLAALLVLLMAADWFDWPLTHTAAMALWQFAEHLLAAAAALVIGVLGARWARDLAATEGATAAEKQAGRYAALGIVAVATLLALAVALSGTGVLIALAILAALALLVWLARGYLPDVTAGLQLRADKVCEVCLDGEPWEVTSVGLVNTRVARRGQLYRMQNRMVLKALQNGAAEAATH